VTNSDFSGLPSAYETSSHFSALVAHCGFVDIYGVGTPRLWPLVDDQAVYFSESGDMMHICPDAALLPD